MDFNFDKLFREILTIATDNKWTVQVSAKTIHINAGRGRASRIELGEKKTVYIVSIYDDQTLDHHRDFGGYDICESNAVTRIKTILEWDFAYFDRVAAKRALPAPA